VPDSPSPATRATGVRLIANLTWAADAATSYDVAFGTITPPPVMLIGQATASYTPTLAAGTRYYWQIVAHNGGGSTSGPIWTFSTAGSTPRPPFTPNSPQPANGTINVGSASTLSWRSGKAASYDVYFGPSTPPPLVSTGQSTATYTPPDLVSRTMYYWQIVAHNGVGSTTGPVWTFTTATSASK
jgi:hypothetical protein